MNVNTNEFATDRNMLSQAHILAQYIKANARATLWKFNEAVLSSAPRDTTAQRAHRFVVETQ